VLATSLNNALKMNLLPNDGDEQKGVTLLRCYSTLPGIVILIQRVQPGFGGEKERGNRLGQFQSFVCGLNHKPLETHTSSAAFSLHPALCLHGHFLFLLFLFLFNVLQVGLITNSHYWGQLTFLEVNIWAIMCVFIFVCGLRVYVGHLGIYFAFNPDWNQKHDGQCHILGSFWFWYWTWIKSHTHLLVFESCFESDIMYLFSESYF